MNDFDFVYFDIDDTLLDHKKAQDNALTDVHASYAAHFREASLETVQETYRIHNSRLWKAYASGDIQREYLQEQRFLRLTEDLDITSVSHRELGTYYLERYAVHWEYCEGARDTFFHIADRYPVGVLTNGFAEVQRAKLDRFGEVRDRLVSTVISEEIGYMKPHPELFKHATSEAQTAASRILYIGDSFFSDVEGGLNAGWQVIWYAPGATDIPEGITHIRSMSELRELV